jgi:uncharacterized membrane protein
MKNGLLSWIVLLVAAGVLVKLHLEWAPQLPERVAAHFDLGGRVTRMRLTGAFGLGTWAMHLGLAALVVGLMSLLHLLSPRDINVPNADYWRRPENFKLACQYLRDWSRWFAAALIIWGTFFDQQLFLANQRQPPHLDTQAMSILITAVILGMSLLIGVLWLRFSRIPSDRKDSSGG